ncbi:ABC-F family ATP-binding cassette domain-containing protein [Microcella daejeonensis]|uniref:ABC-F family ATP-binding cassette domain-containing protein n=1 Tax=Microcella daejeonensis TaxID=2994971 RepID=A0A9E8MIT1_9MICO|nr:ABC-F family ATP-binding cassette domain-containing protein [Microcella daejeonensis]WAB80338.1 ABC-F family ATP-binding cassette domain-containing protein [Microcella daejeonensis]
MSSPQHSSASAAASSSPSAAATAAIIARGIARSFDRGPVLDGVDLVVPAGARIGLIGENGAGKSTLLRILAGVEAADAGELSRPARLGYLPQEVPFDPDAPVGSLIDAAVAPLRAIERELEGAAEGLAGVLGGTAPAAAERYAAALAAAERAELWGWEARRDALLDGFGVAGIPLTTPLGAISGGQRSRLALAALLLERPDALLLDEPTNHLDDAAVATLRTALLGWRGPVLLASHDRALLDEVATAIVDLDPARRALGGPEGAVAQRYGGGFSEYLLEKARERERWEQRFAEEQRELDRLRGGVAVTARALDTGPKPPRDNDKFIGHFKGRRTEAATRRRVRSAEQRLERLEAEQLRRPPAPLTFSGVPAGTTPITEGVLVQLRGAAVPGRLAPIDLRITALDRVLVTGANGAGKSTLLAVIAGALGHEGVRDARRGLRVGTLEQDARFADPDRTPRAIYEGILGERHAAAHPLRDLGLIAPADLDRPVGALSLGQQRRLALALVIARPPHLLLLDEPTNHLSLRLAGELEAALGSYPGAVVVASHDRWLRARWEGRELAL